MSDRTRRILGVCTGDCHVVSRVGGSRSCAVCGGGDCLAARERMCFRRPAKRRRNTQNCPGSVAEQACRRAPEGVYGTGGSRQAGGFAAAPVPSVRRRRSHPQLRRGGDLGRLEPFRRCGRRSVVRTRRGANAGRSPEGCGRHIQPGDRHAACIRRSMEQARHRLFPAR